MSWSGHLRPVHREHVFRHLWAQLRVPTFPGVLTEVRRQDVEKVPSDSWEGNASEQNSERNGTESGTPKNVGSRRERGRRIFQDRGRQTIPEKDCKYLQLCGHMVLVARESSPGEHVKEQAWLRSHKTLFVPKQK